MNPRDTDLSAHARKYAGILGRGETLKDVEAKQLVRVLLELAELAEAHEKAGSKRPPKQAAGAVLATLRAMIQREPRGTVLSIEALRRRVRPLSRGDVDAALLGLAQRGAVVLHRHDRPAVLSREEQALLLVDVQEDAYHHGICLPASEDEILGLRDEPLEVFAKRAVAAATRVGPEGRFPEGDRNGEKVYIYAVAQEMSMALTDAFRARLVEAHRATLLSLSRADLVQAMTAWKVDTSETRYLNATFHFVRLPDAWGHRPTTLEARIRAAYLLATGGVMNQHIKLARLRAALDGEPAEAVNEELRRMQQRGSTLLYPIDDPQRLRPEDEAAAMRVAGERRDLVCIRG